MGESRAVRVEFNGRTYLRCSRVEAEAECAAGRATWIRRNVVESKIAPRIYLTDGKESPEWRPQPTGLTVEDMERGAFGNCSRSQRARIDAWTGLDADTKSNPSRLAPH